MPRECCHFLTIISDVIMGAMASLILDISIVYSGADQRKHQSLASLAFARRIHGGPVNSPHKGPVTWNMFPFNDVIMCCSWTYIQVSFSAKKNNITITSRAVMGLNHVQIDRLFNSLLMLSTNDKLKLCPSWSDWWIPPQRASERNCFHVMTSSWTVGPILSNSNQ